MIYKIKKDGEKILILSKDTRFFYFKMKDYFEILKEKITFAENIKYFCFAFNSKYYKENKKLEIKYKGHKIYNFVKECRRQKCIIFS